jgi:hypothetical protein
MIRPAMAETVPCPQCNRNNGVRRTACLYCGAALPVTDTTAAVQVPTLKPVEEWEQGFTVVLAPLDADEPEARQVSRLSEIVRLTEDEAAAFLSARVSLPVARVSSFEEADLIARILGASDLGATVVSDASLDLGSMLKRIRALHVDDEGLHALVLWGDWVTLPRADVVRVVEGHVVSTKVDLVEGTGKSRKRMDIVDTAQYFVESYAVDVYGPTLEQSFRIKADSFDYRCLGPARSHRLDANVGALCEMLRGYAGASRYDGDYRRIARLLDHAWPRASRVEARGLTRRGDLKHYTSSSVTTDALAQFTRYSRTRFLLATQ